MVIAPLGQALSHAAQSMHSSLLMTATWSIVIALDGQDSTHDPQALHFSASTTAGMV
jgi:hypothetical protein